VAAMSDDSSTCDTAAIEPDSALIDEVEHHSGEPVSRCYQCRKCTIGCPLAFAMDVMPNQVMRMLQLGLEDEVLGSKTIWLCASCQTCTTRCPNDIDIAHLMDSLRQLGREKQVPPGEKNVVKFHDAFLSSVRRNGRVFELGMVGQYKLSALDLFSDTAIALKMLKRGKLKFLPEGIRGKREVRQMFADSESKLADARSAARADRADRKVRKADEP
jgi:heterodisulfide reductase subunit C